MDKVDPSTIFTTPRSTTKSKTQLPKNSSRFFDTFNEDDCVSRGVLSSLRPFYIVTYSMQDHMDE